MFSIGRSGPLKRLSTHPPPISVDIGPFTPNLFLHPLKFTFLWSLFLHHVLFCILNPLYLHSMLSYISYLSIAEEKRLSLHVLFAFLSFNYCSIFFPLFFDSKNNAIAITTSRTKGLSLLLPPTPIVISHSPHVILTNSHPLSSTHSFTVSCALSHIFLLLCSTVPFSLCITLPLKVCITVFHTQVEIKRKVG